MLFSSYSGDTEETLACFAAAEALGARRIVASTGGALVDAAREAGVPVIGLPGPAAGAAHRGRLHAGLRGRGRRAGRRRAPHRTPRSRPPRLPCASRRGELQARAARSPGGSEGACRSSTALASPPRSPVAGRPRSTRTPKLPAFFSELPEADHNEICGWAGAASRARLAAVLLEDSDQHPRERRRFELTAEAIEAGGAEAIRIETERRDPRRPPALGDDARRPRLAGARRGPRRRSAAGRGDRRAQGRARGLALSAVGSSGLPRSGLEGRRPQLRILRRYQRNRTEKGTDGNRHLRLQSRRHRPRRLRAQGDRPRRGGDARPDADPRGVRGRSSR